jgi:hypothetical protein
MPTPTPKRRSDAAETAVANKKTRDAASTGGTPAFSSENRPKKLPKLAGGATTGGDAPAAANAKKVAEAEEGGATWMEDEEAPFPRGGGSTLTPLERRQVLQQAQNDALFDEGGGDAMDEEEGAAGGMRARLGEAPVTTARLRPASLAQGVLTLVAVREVHSSRAVVTLPDGLFGTLDRLELSDELHDAIAAGELEHPPDLRKLLSVGEVLTAAVLGPPAVASSWRRQAGGPPAPVSLRLSRVQAAALSSGAPLPKGTLLWGVLRSVEECAAAAPPRSAAVASRRCPSPSPPRRSQPAPGAAVAEAPCVEARAAGALWWRSHDKYLPDRAEPDWHLNLPQPW